MTTSRCLKWSLRTESECRGEADEMIPGATTRPRSPRRWLVAAVAAIGVGVAGVWLTAAIQQARTAAQRTADL